MNFQDLESRRLQAQTEFYAKTARAIPEDKSDWKPAETAMSAMEITRHCIQTNNHFCQPLGGEVPDHDPDAANSLAEAVDLLEASCEHMSEVIASIPDERLDEEVPAFGGSMPLTRIVSIPSTHIGYHWGQLAYLQRIWGDTDDHFMG